MPEARRPVAARKGRPSSNRRVLLLAALVAVAMVAITVVVAGSIASRSATSRRSVAPSAVVVVPEQPVLAFADHDRATQDRFFRQGPIAAHVQTTSGPKPRLLVAFPAENGGIGVWFDTADQPVVVTPVGEVEGATRDDMRGVRFTLEARTPMLQVEQAVLSNVRILRRYDHGDSLPPSVRTEPAVTASAATWSRPTIDGARRYTLIIEPQDSATVRKESTGRLVLAAARANAPLRLRVTALSSDPPLTAIAMDDLLTPDAAPDAHARNALAFLSYDEKLLAGSWRFLTYFGRDTLLSVRLLMPVLRPRAIEAGLGSVLERLRSDGDVAHEEDIGEFAMLRNAEMGKPRTALSEPIYDYKMIDDDFLLAPVAAEYLLGTSEGRRRARDFLAKQSGRGVAYSQLLRRNLYLVLERARPFALDPRPENLIALKEGEHAGEWRDSEDGLGGGRIPYDVNAALVPAALDASARLFDSPLLGPDTESANEARRLAAAWTAVGTLFDVRISREQALERVRAYAGEIGVPADAALASVDGPIAFPSLALNPDGSPVPVMHSDDGFVLLFTTPTEQELTRIAGRILRPFPAGLRTDVGIVVSNPVFVEDEAQRRHFSRTHYHGTVVWSWQQALLAAGLRRQLDTRQISPEVRAALLDAELALWAAIRGAERVRTSELWSWSYDTARAEYRVAPFHEGSGAYPESNPVQLWSTVYLAIRPP